MGTIDLTYSINGVSGNNINVSEDGLFSLTIPSDSVESYNFSAISASESVLISGSTVEEFKYVIIVNIDATNSVRVRTKITGADTIDEEILAGRPLIIPSRLFKVQIPSGTDISMDLLDVISVQGIGGDVDLKVFHIK